MRQPLTISFLLLALSVAPAMAQTLSCPDPAQARQVAACPTDAELQYTFTGFCSDNARMYDGAGDVCEDFERYRKLKNIALWESADGVFSGYLSCELPVETIRAAKPTRVTVERTRGLTRVVCDYAADIRFVLRTRAACRVEGSGDCSTPADCRTSCR